MSFLRKKAKVWTTYLSTTPTTDIELEEEQINRSLAFMGITQETLAAIKQSYELLAPHKEEIVAQFYQKIMDVDHLKNIITEHSTIERLRVTMEKYVEQLLQADVNAEYVHTRKIVGIVHSRIHLTAEHFISAHHLIIQAITSILMEKLCNQPDQMIRTVLALQKLAAFDQQLIVGVYTEATIKSFLFDISDMLNNVTQLDITGQLIHTMDKQIQESFNVTSATAQMNASILEVANHANTVSEHTEEAVQSAEQSKDVINNALDNIQRVGLVYQDVLDQVRQLHTEIEHTQNIVGVIRDIADQTNLLALNASIEAARAGEAGIGFSVVASEVRKLSEHTKEQITRVSANMSALQHVSNAVTLQISNTGKLVSQSVSNAQIADSALNDIVTRIKEVSQATTQIAAMAEEQSATVSDIADRNAEIYELSSSSYEITKQTAQLIFDLSKEMEHYRNSFFQINVSLQPKDLIRAAKTDHLLWKWKVYNVLLGFEQLQAHQIASHQDCRLGGWYYGNVPAAIKKQPAYQALELPHKAVHDYAKQAIGYHEAGDAARAQQMLEKLQNVSNTVVTLLNELESQI